MKRTQTLILNLLHQYPLGFYSRELPAQYLVTVNQDERVLCMTYNLSNAQHRHILFSLLSHEQCVHNLRWSNELWYLFLQAKIRRCSLQQSQLLSYFLDQW